MEEGIKHVELVFVFDVFELVLCAELLEIFVGVVQYPFLHIVRHVFQSKKYDLVVINDRDRKYLRGGAFFGDVAIQVFDICSFGEAIHNLCFYIYKIYLRKIILKQFFFFLLWQRIHEFIDGISIRVAYFDVLYAFTIP